MRCERSKHANCGTSPTNIKGDVCTVKGDETEGFDTGSDEVDGEEMEDASTDAEVSEDAETDNDDGDDEEEDEEEFVEERSKVRI